MAQIVNGYAGRVLSTRLSNEYQEMPEEESWHAEYNLPFKPPKRSASHSYDNQGYPVKRPRNNLEASHPYGRQEQIRAGMNGNINGHPSLHLPAPADLRTHEQAQYGPAAPRPNMVQSTPYHQTGTQSNSMGQHPRLPSQPHFASPTQGNYASSRQSTPQRNHMSPLRASPHTESDLWQPESRKSLAKPFHPGQNTSGQLLQPQIPRGSRASSVAPSQAHTGNHIEFTNPRYHSVPHLPAAHERSVQYAVSGAGALGQSSQPSTQKFQPSQGFQQAPQRFQHSSQGLQHSPQRLQPSPMQARPNTILQTEVQPGGKTSFANEANIQKRPVLKRNGPFIIDDDEEEIGNSEALKPINTEARINTATVSQKSVSTIDFSQGRRGGRSLTHGLDDPKDRKNAISSMQKNKSGVKKSKKADDLALQKLQQQAEAYAKIKEKEDMAAKANDTSALFEEPINEAAQARIKTSMQKGETRKLEVEAKRKHNKALAEDLERIKKEADEREKAQKEAERAEKASRKSKTPEEREAIQKMREAEEKIRQEEQKRKAEELLLRRRQEQSEQEALAREKEAAAESKRQQDAENLKKTLEASRLAATSLKPAKKGQGGRQEIGERAITAAIETLDLPVDDGGLFVPEQIGVEPSDETDPTDRNIAVHPGGDIQHPPLTPTSPPRGNSIPNIKTVTSNTEQKVSNIAATIKEIPGSEALSLRALAGWRGARKANTETKVASIVIEHHKEKLSADQKMRDEALAQERARERIELKEDFAAFFDNLASTLTGQVKGELKVAVDKVLNVRPPTVPMNARSGINPARVITVSPKKYASETQCFLRPNATKLSPLGKKTPSDNDTRREKDELRLAEKAKKRFEVKLHRDNAEQSRSMTEYEFRSHIERQKEYREKREKKFEKEKRMMPHGGGSPQGQVRFGYEDVDFSEVNSSRPNQSNSQSDKGRCGGIMARLRESNGSLGHFQEAAAAKIVDDRLNHLGDDTDSEIEVSEEDPDDDEADATPIYRSKPAAPSDRRDRTSSITATEADGTAANGRSFGSDSRTTQLIKPRHLQDKEMVYIFSVQRSEIRDQEKSLPITIKQFFDRDDANEFAEEELRRTRWGPSMSRPQITQSYSKETGLFNGSAAIDSEENMVECVDVVAQAQYIGDLDDFEHEKVKVIFKPKVYFIFKSTTKKVQTPMESYDDEAGENSEAEQTMETDENGEAEQAMQTDQNEDAEQNKDMDQDDNEKSNDRKSESSRESDADAIDALFEEEAEVELSDSCGHNLAANVHQLSLDSTEPPESKPEMTLTQTSKPLEVYTDRELANKRASEIFLAAIRPVGGDISQLVAFQNDAVKPIRESLENHNKSGELFSASNDYEDNGQVRVWVEDFEIKGPLN
ncbi:hypothetical protein V502_00070 [Pseudogymnoascus sp. VKM F-4520 (FW-2644)]|nr:hypothetical protein V502_00070 [Pseudogymnoascus sp. VKM F-4520 (FW-2644)]